MLTIYKRKGTTEPFDPEKIKNSLAVASDDAGQPLNTSSLNSIIKELEGLLEGKQQATSQQVYVMLVGILCTRGYTAILNQYMSYTHNAFRGN